MKWKVGDEFYIIDNEKDSLGFAKPDIKRPYKIASLELLDNGNDPGNNHNDYVWFEAFNQYSLYYVSKSNIKPVSKLHKVLA